MQMLTRASLYWRGSANANIAMPTIKEMGTMSFKNVDAHMRSAVNANVTWSQVVFRCGTSKRCFQAVNVVPKLNWLLDRRNRSWLTVSGIRSSSGLGWSNSEEGGHTTTRAQVLSQRQRTTMPTVLTT